MRIWHLASSPWVMIWALCQIGNKGEAVTSPWTKDQKG